MVNFPVQVELPDQLWAAVEKSYESSNYRGAILDAVVALFTSIRETTGLDADGASLVGRAFGGDSPLLRVNKLRTESEKSEQRGIDAILRGLYLAVRNPRAHGHIEDDKQTCDSILITVAWLWKIIDSASTQFATDTFLERVTDRLFVKSDEYVQLLVEEIPETKVFDVSVALLDSRKAIEPTVFGLMLQALEGRLTEEQAEEVHVLASEILQSTHDDKDIPRLLSAYAGERWGKIKKVARLRTENKLLVALDSGRYDLQSDQVIGGFLATWIPRISNSLDMKDSYRKRLLRKLRSENYEEQEFLFQRFRKELFQWTEEPDPALLRIIEWGLRRGDKRFYEAIEVQISLWEVPESLREAYDEFQPVELKPFWLEDEVPF